MSRTATIPNRLGASSLGYLLDRVLGELPDSFHPLRAFGSTMALLERIIYRDDRRHGVHYAIIGTSLGAASGSVLSSTAVATYFSCGGRALRDAATVVQRALDNGDLDRARTATSRIVGRETQNLDEEELARAVVETVAENTIDAVVAPLLWGAIGGPRGALAYRAVNTMDAMVGYRSPRYHNFGWASARLDDVANYVPARLGVLGVMVVRPRLAPEIWRTVRRDASSHPSPNAGVIESAFAGALGISLGGDNTYEGIAETRARLGDGRPPESADITRAVRLSRATGDAVALALSVGAVALIANQHRRHARRSAP